MCGNMALKLRADGSGGTVYTTTIDIYCHMFEEAQAKVSEAVSAALTFHANQNQPEENCPPARN